MTTEQDEHLREAETIKFSNTLKTENKAEQKKLVNCTIAVHPIQANIIEGLKSGEIDLQKHSLREIATLAKDKSNSAQKIKYHLQQLVKLGVIAIINGQYIYFKNPYATPFTPYK